MSSVRLRKNYLESARRLKAAIEEAKLHLDNEDTSLKRLVTTLNVLKAYARRNDDIASNISSVGDSEEGEKEENERVTEDHITLMLDFDEVSEKLKVSIACLEKGSISPSNCPNDHPDSIQVSQHTSYIPPTAINSVRLPKLTLPSFDGDIMKWQEFWDSFDSAVHSNNSLNKVDKFNYLKAQLIGDSKLCIDGLSLTSDNYDIAITMLQDRFANNQLIINSHYKALMDLRPLKSSETNKLRFLFDTIEKHSRCLQNLGEDTNSNFFVSLIMKKLPIDIVVKVEEQNTDNNMDAKTLCKLIKSILQARERSEILLGINTKGSQGSQSFQSEHKRDLQSFNGGHFTTTQALSNPDNKNPPCIFCKENHWSDQCQRYKTVDERKGKVKGLCFICLKGGHSLKDCKINKPCVYCKQRKNHHRSLCSKQFSHQFGPNPNSAVNSNFCNEISFVSANENVILQTAKVELIEKGLTEPARVLFDTGSQRSYISKSLASKLKLLSNDTQILSIFTFGNREAKTIETQTVTTCLKLNDGNVLNLQCNVVPQITGKLRACSSIDVTRIQSLYPSLSLAEGQNADSEIELLIGNDYYFDIITSEKIQVHDGLYLVGSKIGWIISGREKMPNDAKFSYSTSFLTTIQPTNLFRVSDHYETPDSQLVSDLNVKDLWSLDSLGIRDCPYQNDDDIALSQFNEKVKLENGRYSVGWPWKEYPPNLSKNFGLSLARLKSLVHRFENHTNVLQQYDKIIKDQLSCGIIEKVPINDDALVIHYVPHHPVINESKTTTKLRIVYDASAKSKRTTNSLNDCLYRGPVILEDLCGLLMRFQFNEVAVIADIEKAFLQLQLNEPDRNVTRFLWLKDISLPVDQSNVEEFRFCRVPFGVISSPFLLSATIKYHLSRSNLTGVSEKLKNSFYVDNVVTGVKDDREVYELFNSANHLFSQAGMNLQGWCSNSQTFMGMIPPCKMTKEDLSNVNVLGLRWDTVHDNLLIHPVKSEITSCTKRSVLKIVSSVFDPTGVFNPSVLKAKLFIQRLWEENFDWDDKLTEEMCLEWEKIQRDVLEISELSIPRYIGLEVTTVELHCFSDASQACYSTAIYVRVTKEGIVKSKLIFSKSHLSPSKKKSITMPRLELLGVLIGSRSLNFVENNLKLPVTKKVIWTDSQCVLHWLNTAKILPKFVDRRISEIKANRDVIFRYVPSEDNPSDVATRGMTVQELRHCEKWWTGPQWFKLPENDWPRWKFNPSSEFNEENTKEEIVVLNDASKEEVLEPPFGIDLSRFSNLQKLLRVTSYCKRFISKCLNHQNTRQCTYITAAELRSAQLDWEKYVQKKNFNQTLRNIETKKNDPLQKRLRLFLDDDGLLRCSGRLLNAALPQDFKFPKLLPKNEEFTTLVIKNYHNGLFHAGVHHTLAEIRKEYWVVNGRSQVFKTITSCPTCIKWEGGPYKLPPMPPLPAE